MNEFSATAMDPFGVLDKVKAGEMRFLRPSMMGQLQMWATVPVDE